MTRPFTGLRRVALSAACLAAAVVGASLVFRLVTPQSVQKLGTQELLALLGVLVLPLATLGVAHAEARRLALLGEPEAEAAAGPFVPAAARGPDLIVHSAPGRRDAQRHRRLVPISRADAA